MDVNLCRDMAPNTGSDVRVGISMPGLSTPLERFREYAELAETAGFDSVWDYEFYRNPFVVHAGAAAATDSIQLATGIAEAFTRSPFELANAAADIDDLSDGRLVLGIGTGGADFLEAFHSTDARKPVSRMREFIDVLRLSWDHLGTMEPASYEGSFYRFQSLPLNPWGGRQLARARIPIYLAAIRPKMLQLAGEKADGVLGYLWTPEYVRDRVLPNVSKGASESGREASTVDIAGLVICSVSDDREVALRRARIQVGMYVAYPLSDVMVQFHGFEQEQQAIREAMLSEGMAALERVTSDKLVETFSLAGTPDEVRDQMGPYEEVLSHVVLHTPYVPPLTADECDDAFRGIVDTLGRAHV
jgi:probable F420-dependent oxidoreductase